MPPLYAPPVVVQWLTPEKLFYQEWEFWLVLFTFVLAVVTAWLAMETHGLRKDSAKSIRVAENSAQAAKDTAEATLTSVQIARQQFAASVQPVFVTGFTMRMTGSSSSFGKESFHITGDVHFRNEGTVPFKITNLYVVAQRHEENNFVQYAVELPSFQQRVITPSLPINERVTLEVKSETDHDALFGLHIVCVDMGGSFPNAYVWHPTQGLRHSTGPIPPPFPPPKYH